MSERILGKVVLLCVAVLCASCAVGRRGCERAYASDDVRVFLEGLRLERADGPVSDSSHV